MFVLSSPSGAGKSTIAQLLLNEDDNLDLSVSVTTREKRSSEVDGVHYHFRTREQFEKMVEHEELLEWAEVHGNYYGTPRQFVEEKLQAGTDVLFDIDVQGTYQINEKMPEDVATIFILPPSIAEMKSRLKRRAEDSDEVILRRMKTAVSELEAWPDYEYLVVNEELEKAFNEVKSILTAERMRQRRQGAHSALAKTLHEDLIKETS
ncbi:MAG: guanylate kinase [Hyphomicrobiales bacterium]